MVGAGADGKDLDFLAKFEDAVVIGGDDEGVEFAALLGAFDDVLEEGFSEEGVEGLSGEASGGPAGRDDADDFAL